MAKNPAHGFDEVVRDRVRAQPFGRARFFGGAVARPHEHPAAADRAGQRHVQPPVADDERGGGVDAELAYGAIDQAAPRLPAIARLRVLLHFAVRVVRTIVIRIDVRPAGLEQVGDMAVHAFDDRFAEEPARDARLVRDHHDAQPGSVERAHRVDAPRIQGDALDAIEIADLFDERAVAVDEHGARRLP